jgi:hypothetical protein
MQADPARTPATIDALLAAAQGRRPAAARTSAGDFREASAVRDTRPLAMTAEGFPGKGHNAQ